MAVTAWTTVHPALLIGTPKAAPGAFVVPSGGATPVPTSGRGYPRGNR